MAKKVLVVEDDSNIAELLRLYLEKDGFDVFLAADGGEGIRRAQHRAAGPELYRQSVLYERAEIRDPQKRRPALYLVERPGIEPRRRQLLKGRRRVYQPPEMPRHSL